MKRQAQRDSIAVGFQLPYKKLNEVQQEELAQIMRAGGEVLKEAHLKVRAAKRKAASEPKLSYCRRAFRIELFKQVGSTPRPVAICGVLITKEEVSKIYAIRAREVQILEGYSNLVRKIITSKTKTDETYISIDDCCEEGAMAIIDAAYHYTKKDTAFVTFVYWAIFRRICRALNRAKSNFPWSVKMRELFQLYQTAKTDMNRPANFEDVVQYMGLNNEDREILRAALVKIISESDGDEDETGTGNNYLDNAVADESTVLEADELSIIGAAKLDNWEQAVLEAFLSGHYGWRTEVATKFGKSKAAPAICLERVIRKIQMAFDLGGDCPCGDNPALRRLLNAYNGKEEEVA